MLSRSSLMQAPASSPLTIEVLATLLDQSEATIKRSLANNISLAAAGASQTTSTQWQPIVEMEAVACRKRPRLGLTAHVSVACGHGAAHDWRRIRGEAHHAA